MEFLFKIAHFVRDGGPVEYFIMVLMACGLSIFLERCWFFFIKCRLNAKQLLADVTALVRKDQSGQARKLCNQTGTPLGFILEAGLWRFEQAGTPQDIKDSLEEVSLRELPRLQKRTHYLSLLANLSTLVGLLGTIFGLQEAFAALESADPSQKSKLLARGITLALNATALGLLSAMLCMAGHTFLGSKANQLLEQIDETALRLTNFLNSQRKSQA
jgi:biopolymer transport protein ExbB